VIVAIDGTPLTVSSGGVRRYTEELIRALRATFPDDSFHVISDQLQTVSGLNRRWWTIGVQREMRRLRCDLFHGTEFSVPYLPLKPSVLTLHDLSPWMSPQWHHAADRVRRRTPHLLRFGVATMILTDTEAVRRAAIDFFRLSPDRIVSVPLAASEHLRPVETPLPAVPYFLYVGTIEPRKNVPALVEAWKQVRSRHRVDLVLAGRRREDAPEIPSAPGLCMLGEVGESDLPGLYSACIACVYPTEYEGFGLPVLEAMQCGAPVITSHDPAVTEVSGGAAIHVSPDDLANAMERILTSCEERARRKQLSIRRAAEFSWAKTVTLTRAVYEEAIRRFQIRRFYA
jgi:glycosyltransferase involved in cell wall biosynthesis